jgi:hypothetical protein
LRPGELLEFGLIGAAGLLAWHVVGAGRSWRARSIGWLLFTVPLLNTWPARAFVAQIDSLGDATAIVAPATLIGLLVVLLASGSRPVGSRLAATVGGLFVLSALVSTAVSDDRGSAAALAWLGLVLPVAVAAVLASGKRTLRERWAFVAAPAIAALVPAAMGLTAFYLAFGLPRGLQDFIDAEAALYRPGIVQELTFGNIAHLAAFSLLAMPVAAVAAFSPVLPTPARAGSAVSAVLLVAALFIAVSRAAFVVLSLMLAAAAVLAATRLWRHSTAAVAVSGALAVAAAGSLWVGQVALAGEPSAPEQPREVGAGEELLSTGDYSIAFRANAVRRGLDVFEANPLGVGSGEYAAHDPVHTAPHSLAVLLLAENGVLGGLALGALLFLLAVSAWRLLTYTLPMEEWLLRAGCLLGAFGFLGFGVLAGTPLTVGPVATWSLLLACQIGSLLCSESANES